MRLLERSNRAANSVSVPGELEVDPSRWEDLQKGDRRSVTVTMATKMMPAFIDSSMMPSFSPTAKAARQRRVAWRT